MIRKTTLVALITIAVVMSADVGLGADRRASQRIKNTVHPLRGMNAEDAVKILTATLPRTDRSVIIAPQVESGRVIPQAPAYRIRQFQRSLRQIEGPQLFSF